MCFGYPVFFLPLSLLSSLLNLPVEEITGSPVVDDARSGKKSTGRQLANRDHETLRSARACSLHNAFLQHMEGRKSLAETRVIPLPAAQHEIRGFSILRSD